MQRRIKSMLRLNTNQDFLFSTGTKLNESQKHMFMQLSIRNQLDPFKREIYAIPYGNDFNIVTGYQVYIQRAEATGKLDGWHCQAVKDAKGALTGATIIIYRKDFTHPFEWEVSLLEFDKGQSNWKKMPEFMIKKVCIGQGFRLAFPNELGGMPYLAEELEGLQPQQAAARPPIAAPQAKQEKKPEPPAVHDDTEFFQCFIENVSEKHGSTGNKKWTRYGIFDGLNWYNTFDTKLADLAKDAKEMQQEVIRNNSSESRGLYG